MSQLDADKVFNEVEDMFGQVPEWMKAMPESSLTGFWGLFRDFYFAETSLPNKYKELIGLAVAGATRCHYCTLFHTEGARLHGATDEEIAEASMMASITMLGSTFLNAAQIDYERFAEETSEMMEHVRAEQEQATQEVGQKADGASQQHNGAQGDEEHAPMG